MTDVPFETAENVLNISLRLHPIDVGFDLRVQQMAINVGAEDPLRVSYPAEDGSRRVIEGPRSEVLDQLEDLGFEFQARQPRAGE